jgi:hypothetical protein
MRIGLLNNLRAGRNQARVGRLLDCIHGHREVSHVETSAVGAVPEALAELARQDVELLVVNGGDGTLAYALGEILGERAFEGRVPLLAVLRGGRTNMTALDLGTKRDPVRAMAGLIERAQRGEIYRNTIERPVLRVECGPNFGPRYGMFFGAGAIHRGIDLVHRMFPKERQGVFAASILTATLLARMALLGDSQGVLTPDKIGIMADATPIDRGESALVMATSLDRLFLRMRPFWGSGPGGVRLTSIAAQPPGFARALPGILAGRPGNGVGEPEGYVSRNASRVALRMDCGFTVDGELVAPSPDRIVSLSADDTVQFVRA